MDKPLVSILVPCYNTEKYLAKCIESVLAQTYDNFELIILSDGSTDRSSAIMHEYASKDSRVKIIERENKGVAVTRNDLVAASTGEYIMFVDSDDTVSPYIVEDMLKAMNEEHADLVMCPANVVYDDTYVNNFPVDRSCKMEITTNIQTLFNMITEGELYHYLWGKLYNKKLFEGIYFPPNRLYEDSAVLFKIYYNSQKSVVFKQAYYNYLIGRQDSIMTRKYTMRNLNDNYLAIKERYDFLMENVPELENEAIIGYIRNIFTLLNRVYLTDNPELLESSIVSELEKRIPELYSSIKNFKNIEMVLDRFRLAGLYLLISGKKQEYIDILKYINNIRVRARE